MTPAVSITKCFMQANLWSIGKLSSVSTKGVLANTAALKPGGDSASTANGRLCRFGIAAEHGEIFGKIHRLKTVTKPALAAELMTFYAPIRLQAVPKKAG